jgi:hypothetical protein
MITPKLIETTGLTMEEFEKLWETIVYCPPLSDFNGHFWIENYGCVVDDYPFHLELEKFKRAFGIKNKKTKLEYERCDDDITNRIVFGMYKKLFEKSGKTENEVKEIIGKVWTTEPLCCYFNSIANQQKNGGQIVFGSVFMRSDDGKKKHYIIGLPNAKTFNDFKKPYDPFESL